MMEQLIGGERYEMVPLPDSMVDTTLFVGNLNEFVKDGDLSDFFQTVSILQSVPACVARRPNFDSLGYGFVTFPTVEEKEVCERKKGELIFCLVIVIVSVYFHVLNLLVEHRPQL